MNSNIIVRQAILRKFQLVICLLFVFTLIVVYESSAQGSQIIYVRKGAASPGDGTSWNTAYPDLQQALTAATTLPGNKEIWVARGEYKPTTSLNRNIAFTMPLNTILYGGFVGNETSSIGRDWKNNRTVLSGDLGAQFDDSDNSYHVIIATDVNENSLLDGFVVKDGNSNNAGDVEGHYAGAGAGMLIEGTTNLTNPRINNCEFINNKAQLGGAIFNFANNSAISSPIISNTSFVGNVAGVGSVIANIGTIDNFPSFINCVFSSNRSTSGETVANFSKISFANCTFALNENYDSNSPTIYSSEHLELYNSILWRNFNGPFENPVYSPQIRMASQSTSIVQNNIIQGGFGQPEDNNIDADPLFETEPSFLGIYPRTSIIPVSTTDAKYENQLSFNGPKLNGPWPYYAYKDHEYNKLYLPGRNLQVIDYSNLVDNQPTSTIYDQVYFGRTQRLEQSVHTAGNTIYFASYFSGIVSLDRATGQLTDHTPLADEPITYDYAKARDLVVDNTNNLLYAPIFYEPGNVFYGILELNLTTQTKRWITTSSTPVAISAPVSNLDEGAYWGGFRIFLDEPENTFYFSTGNGVWWWNRADNSTGVISTTGGLSLAPGNPNLPSNFTTGMFMDHSENKFYIGTHAGLFVWDRTNNTSKVYNTSNSLLAHDLINHIDKNEEQHLVYVACEEGGLFVINTLTGEEKLITEDVGNEVHPQYMDASAASAYYDEIDKKLYVSADHPSGGVWIQDYNNLIPDYGDLRLKAGSPAIDKGNSEFYPSEITTDIAGLNRFVDYTTIEGANSLDLGAHERIYNVEDEDNPPLEITDVNYILTFSPVTEITNEGAIEGAPVNQVNKNITYFDGLGRPMQSTVIQGSPDRQDIITPIVYDEFGREAKKYLPFVSGSNGSYKPNSSIIDANGNYAGIAETFYDDLTDDIADDPRPFSEVFFEPSPLNRPDKEYGPGEAWAPTGSDKPIRHSYLSNVHSLTGSETAEAIIAWNVDEAGALGKEAFIDGFIENGGYYSSNQLYVKVTYDEHGNAVREYTNKQGQVILKKVQADSNSSDLNNTDEWACTYYVYDDLGNLRIVLPPEGVKQYLIADQN